MTTGSKKGPRLATQIKSLEFANWLVAGTAIGLVSVGLALVAQTILPPEIPLFYGNAQGADQLAGSFTLVLPGSLALGVQAINTLISLGLKDSFAKRILSLAGFAFAILALITTLEIVLLVGAL